MKKKAFGFIMVNVINIYFDQTPRVCEIYITFGFYHPLMKQSSFSGFSI
ncbi:hypothetical protein DCCM_0666 [Desulfocucumis palustris]|uniref:Uncharacterized protein n=1 Tax=Desulfocucumis palustris TaxID=1898651 RepID=A0A2L2X8X2_9FIRM|nr:hypothetical protein [Desulfocucumis palustris]GBF32470.1 hypothetical protein DCCM_0666 [Desulfocucumis palustris]